MITNNQVENFYKSAIEVLEDKLLKRMLKEKMDWYNNTTGNNKEKVLMIANFLSN